MAERLKAHPGLARVDNLDNPAVVHGARCYPGEFLPHQRFAVLSIKVGEAVTATVFDENSHFPVLHRRLGVVGIVMSSSDGDDKKAGHAVLTLREVNADEAGTLAYELGTELSSTEFWKGVAPELMKYDEGELQRMGLGLGYADDIPALVLQPTNP